MIALIIVGVVCLFLGWNLPQPQYAKDFQAWVIGKVRGFTKAPGT